MKHYPGNHRLELAVRSPVDGHVFLNEYCYRLDADGRQHFNFSQRIWLRPRLAMAMTPVFTLALETLAVNLLALATRERDSRAPLDVASSNGLRLARMFCEQCLLTADAEGWVMPRTTVRSWVGAHSRRGPAL